MTVEEFQTWVRGAPKGARIEYYRGNLIAERPYLRSSELGLVNYVRAAGTPRKFVVYTPFRRTARLMAERGFGQGHLFQKREGEDDYRYIFERS